MKILFLTLYPDFAPSSRFRTGQYLRFFHADGIRTEVVSAIPTAAYRRFATTNHWWRAIGYHLTELSNRTLTLLRRSDHDVVVLQKGILSFYLRGMERLLGQFQGRLVFDLDDAVHLRAPNHLPKVLRFLEDSSQTRRILGLCRSVIAANKELATAIKPFAKTVHVIPTPVDTDYFTISPARAKETAPFQILWMGNRSGNVVVNRMASVVAELGRRGIKAKLTVLSDSPDFIRTEEFLRGTLEFRKWSLEAEKECLASAHVGAMPVDDNPWNRAKSGFKTMLYMACGLPSVSSPIGSITEVVRHGENGFFAKDQSEWTDILQQISSDKALCLRVGNNARQTIEKGYSVKVQYPRLKQALFPVSK